MNDNRCDSNVTGRRAAAAICEARVAVAAVTIQLRSCGEQSLDAPSNTPLWPNLELRVALRRRQFRRDNPTTEAYSGQGRDFATPVDGPAVVEQLAEGGWRLRVPGHLLLALHRGLAALPPVGPLSPARAAYFPMPD